MRETRKPLRRPYQITLEACLKRENHFAPRVESLSRRAKVAFEFELWKSKNSGAIFLIDFFLWNKANGADFCDFVDQAIFTSTPRCVSDAKTPLGLA